MAFRGRVGIEVDTRAFNTSIGPTFMELRRSAVGYAEERARRIAFLAGLIAPRLKRPDPRFYPGELADSIAVERIGQATWEITVGVRWAAFLEFGTSKMPAQPYLRPAVAMVEAESR
jgi:HK97 gp10 family phage protein